MRHNRTCDRCGKDFTPLQRNSLLLQQTKVDGMGDYTSRSHEFDLCNNCAREVFRFVGEGVKK